MSFFHSNIDVCRPAMCYVQVVIRKMMNEATSLAALKRTLEDQKLKLEEQDKDQSKMNDELLQKLEKKTKRERDLKVTVNRTR